MLLKYFYDRTLAQASYMVGCQETGEALVIDPARDIAPYLDTAQREGLRIVHITETHIHADFLSGARELAAWTGGRLYLSAMGGADWQYGFDDGCTTLLRDGDRIEVGRIRLDVLHTPGHTPEHLCFLLTDTPAADAPMGIFTGDCLFAGDMGRPDLLETAAGVKGSSEIGARGQFANVQRFRAMADYLQVWPGHGAGSACGKALGAVPSTTLGYEKRFNPAFQFEDEAAFVAWLLQDQPETPTYFAQMKRVNRDGSALVGDLSYPEQLEGFILPQVLKDGALVIDVVNGASHAYIPGVLSIPYGDSFATYVGWFVDYQAPVYLIAPPDEIDRLLRDLRSIGVDNVAGYFAPQQLQDYTVDLESVSAAELARRLDEGRVLLLDVRALSEYRDSRIAGALHIPYGLLPRRLDDIPRGRPVVTQCATGVRSQIAVSVLRRAGFEAVMNLDGGINAWKSAGLPVETGHAG